MKLAFIKEFGFFTMLLYNFLTILRISNNIVHAYIGSEIFSYIEKSSLKGIGRYVLISILGVAVVTIGKLLHAKMTNYLTYMYLSTLRLNLVDALFHNQDICNRDVSKSHLSLFTNDLTQLEQHYLTPKFELILEFWSFTITALVSLMYDVKLTLIIATISFSALLVPKLFQSSTKALGNQLTARQQQYLLTVNELLTGISTIKYFGIETNRRQAYQAISQDVDQTNQALHNKLDEAFALNNIIGALAYILISVFGAYFISYKGLAIASFLAIIQLSNTLTLPVEAAAGIISKLNGTTFLRTKLADFIQGHQHSPECEQIAPTEDVFRLTNMSYAVGGVNLFTVFNYQITKGDKLLISGPSGSGKSTLINLLMKTLTPSSGEITLFGRDLTALTPSTVYQTVTYVEQDPFIFNDTIVFNITLGRQYSTQDLDRAIAFALLEDVVAEKGWHYRVGEAGNLLSGGQKQRLSIARAYLLKRPILILDEATSGLDQQTANQIEENILALTDRTIIWIAHHPQNIEAFSDIMTLSPHSKIGVAQTNVVHRK